MYALGLNIKVGVQCISTKIFRQAFIGKSGRKLAKQSTSGRKHFKGNCKTDLKKQILNIFKYGTAKK